MTKKEFQYERFNKEFDEEKNIFSLKKARQEVDFDFYSTKLGRVRKVLSLYLFELLINTTIDLIDLILYLERIDTSDIVLRLKQIIFMVNKAKILESNKDTETSRRFTIKEYNLFKKLTEREIKTLQDMATHYSDTFTKYFSDLINIIKLLIISNKSHKIIGADFSPLPFTRFLMKVKGINLFIGEDRFRKVVVEIFDYLRNNKYSNLFPTRSRTVKRNPGELLKVIGSRIKLFIMKCVYDGKYFDSERGIAICPDCLKEDFIIHTSFPRIRSKEFHHEDLRVDGYSIEELYRFFTGNRGNPYFLQELIQKIEEEQVVIKCGCHHSLFSAIHFINYKKLISWENIPIEFPQDIFDLPAEIIHIIVLICVDNSPSSLIEPLSSGGNGFDIENRKIKVRNFILYHLKKRYIIDCIYRGVCPICGEFNTRDHLSAFEFNHLYELNDLMLEGGGEGRGEKIQRLYERFSCSDLVRELERQEGGYICRNCHRVIHKDISIINKIYDNPETIRRVIMDYETTLEKYRQNLIHYNESIKDPLKSEKVNNISFMEHLKAIFEISEKKEDLIKKRLLKREESGITRNELIDNIGITRYAYVFENRKVSEKYIRIEAGTTKRPTKYYMTEEGKKIMRLIFYFGEYYKDIYDNR